MLQVFIENEAGSTTKHHHDEKALQPLFDEEVARSFPYPYGFVIGTTSGDGDNVDCFVITDIALRTGEILEVAPLALLEQTEAGEINHNVLAVPLGAEEHLPPGAEQTLRDFILNFRSHQPEVVNTAGRLLDRAAAEAFVEECRDLIGDSS
jgi:inorganic pyrophosphatase